MGNIWTKPINQPDILQSVWRVIQDVFLAFLTAVTLALSFIAFRMIFLEGLSLHTFVPWMVYVLFAIGLMTAMTIAGCILVILKRAFRLLLAAVLFLSCSVNGCAIFLGTLKINAKPSPINDFGYSVFFLGLGFLLIPIVLAIVRCRRKA